MSLTYQTEGIILKTMPMGEGDRLLTIFSPDKGLIKAIAPGARKPKSKLGGRTSLFVVNRLMCSRGRSLDKVLQAEVKDSFPKLSQHLAKLTSAQYWAELILFQSIEGQEDSQLYALQLNLLKQLETSPDQDLIFLLLHGISQLLYTAGISPELNHCCQSQHPINEQVINTGKGVYFSYADGGTVIGDVLYPAIVGQNQLSDVTKTDYTRTNTCIYSSKSGVKYPKSGTRHHRLTLPQWVILNTIAPWQHDDCLTQNPKDLGLRAWLAVEKILRGYAQHHFDRAIRSATLVESVFAPSLPP